MRVYKFDGLMGFRNSNMLRKLKIQVFTLIAFIYIAPVSAIAPSAQQIEQFKQMPRAQQEALARQMGIDISEFQLPSQGGDIRSDELEND
jgi:hypothetical protein